jgi:hypothetical protein
LNRSLSRHQPANGGRGHFADDRFRLGSNVGRRAGVWRKGLLADPCASFRQSAQTRFLDHDFGVGRDVRRARRGLCEVNEIRQPANVLPKVNACEPIRQCHRVNRLALRGLLGDRLENQRVIAAVLTVAGVTDVTACTINGAATNYTPALTSIATLASVAVS